MDKTYEAIMAIKDAHGFWRSVGEIAWHWWMIPVVLFLIGLLVAKSDAAHNERHSYRSYSGAWKSYDERSRGVTLIALSVLSLLGVTVFGGVLNDEAFDYDWKQEYAYPYIQSLPEKKAEVVFIKISTETEIKHSYGAYYSYYTSNKLTPMTISFKGNGVETYTDWYDARMELTDQEKPYVSYRVLPKSLDMSIPAGMYDVKVYLPKSYTFTDIK